ncbi:hypothetical protein J5N97_027754 [Dioscorea zingiberensis]|uniref:Uncharacterized protein n=1 Tax=Dioscorea zingiberensis TaxID=325984 RepID=A0A9D5BX94_9LILI|nr:hypothetical protein J5N97_027754 [Dioscorea zingiberensis]
MVRGHGGVFRGGGGAGGGGGFGGGGGGGLGGGGGGGGLIIGREVPHNASFITAAELVARRNSRAVEGRRQMQNEIETSQHTTSDFGAPEISTQQSMTNAAVQEDHQI